jgi:hypothetical protein
LSYTSGIGDELEGRLHRRSKAGFFVLIHARVRPLTYREPMRLERSVL